MSFQNFRSFFIDSSERDMKGENAHFYGFGRFTLDVAEQRLSDSENLIPLTPKAFDVLSLLVQHAGHLVEKEELLQHVWPDSFVEESNVAKIVHTLRKTLGDDGNGNSFIETVPTKGYRFVAEVELIEGPAREDVSTNASAEDSEIESTTEVPAATALTESLGGASYRRHYFVAGAIVVVSVLVTGFWISNGSLMPRPLTRFVRHSLNGEAYNDFRDGKFIMESQAPDKYNKALEKFEKAIELDPDYAEAYAGKADVKSYAGVSTRTNDDIATARAAIKKALELDPNSSYVRTINCRIMGTEDWDFYDAVDECERAVALDPNDAGAHRELSLALNVIGQSDEAVSEIDVALAISPTSDIKRARGMALYMARRYDEAIEQFEQLVATDPDFKDGYKWLMLAFAMKNDQANAFENLIKFNELQDASPDDIRAARSAYETGGLPAAVRATLDAPSGIGRKQLYVVADLFALIGENDEALGVLSGMRAGRKIMMVNVPRDPMLDPIRDEPRYKEIVSEMNLK